MNAGLLGAYAPALRVRDLRKIPARMCVLLIRLSLPFGISIPNGA